MKRIILLILGSLLLALAINCGGTTKTGTPAGADSPTEAYKRLFAAVKGKDVEAIKKELSAKSIELAKMSSVKNNTPIDKVFENGFTATTFSPTLPEVRDERVAGDQGAIEVWNTKDSRWEDLPFVQEGGSWKLAVGDLFAGTFKAEDVGRGRSYREAEAANAAGKGPVGINANSTANAGPRMLDLNAANAANKAK